jgi:hypothetical protein
MKVKYNGTNEKLIDSVDFINDLLTLDDFYDEISSHPSFTHDDDGYMPKIISEILKADQSEVMVRTYKSKWRWSKANAYVSPKFKDTLFYNSRKLWRLRVDIINTVVHECVHVADHNDNNKTNFGHGDNKSKGKDNSAPYWIGNLAGKYYKNEMKEEVEIETIDIDESLIID